MFFAFSARRQIAGEEKRQCVNSDISEVKEEKETLKVNSLKGRRWGVEDENELIGCLLMADVRWQEVSGSI